MTERRKAFVKSDRQSERKNRRTLWWGDTPPVRMTASMPMALANKLDRIAKRHHITQGATMRWLIGEGIKATGEK